MVKSHAPPIPIQQFQSLTHCGRSAGPQNRSHGPEVGLGEGTARIWDAATAEEIAVLRGHDDSVFSAAFSPDGSRIVTASRDKTTRIWDTATAREIAVLRA